MEANKAPEKICLDTALDTLTKALSVKTEDAVEYTRTDAFIEKACDAYCAICDTKECDGCAECTWVIKFRRQLLKY